MRVLSILLALAAVLARVDGAVVGVDLGGEHLKVALVAPGRTPIAIALNEASKRKSAVAVSFGMGERSVGDRAYDMHARAPTETATRHRDALGARADSKRVETIVEGSKLAYEVRGDDARDGATRVKLGSGTYAVEELTAMTLEHARDVGESGGRGRVRDAVIAVPPFASQSMRRALRDAAEIAGMNVMAMRSDLACAALQWGIDKEFPEPKYVVIADMGHTSSGAALVKYDQFTSGRGAKKTHGMFDILAVRWDESAGGDALDMLLVNHFLEDFKAKHGTDLSTNALAIGKMRKQVRKTKEILSANKDAPFSVESLHDEIDLRSKITRDEFSKLAGDRFQRMVGPLRQIVGILGDFNLTLDDIEVVEVIGGSSRVPGVKEEIEKAINGRKFDVHLDADEAVAMGAGLFAANMSTTFRMRKFGASDAMPHGMTYSVSPSDDFTSGEIESLVPAFASAPLRRRVQLLNRTADATFTVKLEVSEGTPLPPGTDTDQVMIVEVTGVKEAMAKYNDTVGKMNVYFEFDAHGVLDVEEAVYAVEIIDYVPEKPKKTLKKANVTSTNLTSEDANSTAENAAENTTEDVKEEESAAEAEEPAVKEKEAPEEEAPKMKMRRRVFKTPLTVKVSGLDMEPMTQAQLGASIKVLDELRKIDEAKREQEAAKSNLESYIYSTRAKLDEDEIQAVTTEEQREALKEELMEKEDWLYMDGAHASAAEYKKTHDDLKTKGDAIEFRAKEQIRRPEMITKARAFVAKATPEIESWPEKKPWLNETHVADLLVEVKEFEAWLDEKVVAQDKLAVTDAPSLESAEIKVRMRPIETKFSKMKKKSKPKPPKVYLNATDANATDANATTVEADSTEVESNATNEGAKEEFTTAEPTIDADAATEAESVKDEL